MSVCVCVEQIAKERAREGRAKQRAKGGTHREREREREKLYKNKGEVGGHHAEVNRVRREEEACRDGHQEAHLENIHTHIPYTNQ